MMNGTQNVQTYARIKNVGKVTISNGLEYCDPLVRPRYPEHIKPGKFSRVYPITREGCYALMNSGIMAERVTRPDGSVFLLFTIEKRA